MHYALFLFYWQGILSHKTGIRNLMRLWFRSLTSNYAFNA